MKFNNNTLMILLAIVLLAGCATIKGNTVADQRQYVLDMREEVLARLYEETPIAKEQIKRPPDMESSVILTLICFS